MRFNKSALFRLSSYSLKKKEFQKYLMTILRLNSNEVEQLFDMKKTIITLPRQRVLNSCTLLQKYNVNIRPLSDLQYSFMFNHHCLEHRINMLKDMGVSNLDVTLITKASFLFRNHLPKFKTLANIPAEQSISKNIFDRLGSQVPQNISELESSNKLTVNQFYQACLLYCKTEIFNVSYLSDKVLLHSYGRLKSASMIGETLKLLRNDLGYSEEIIKTHAYVIKASAENIRLLLNSFDDLYGIPIATFLRKYPQTLFQDPNNIKQLLVSLKRYKIPDEQVKNYIKILKVDNETFLERMEMIKRHSDLHIWLRHPRILDLIFHVNMTKDRVGFLNVINRINWARPHTILSKIATLEKHLQNNTSIVSTKKDLRYIFLKELETDNISLINSLARHKHWKAVGFVEIHQILKYLKKHFTISDICQNIHIVLYAQSRVEKILADLKEQYSNGAEFSLTSSQYLALCLYMLEKDNHFTDDGIWSERFNNIKQESLDPLNFKSNPNDINNNTSISNDTVSDDLSIEGSESSIRDAVNDDLTSSSRKHQHT